MQLLCGMTGLASLIRTVPAPILLGLLTAAHRSSLTTHCSLFAVRCSLLPCSCVCCSLPHRLGSIDLCPSNLYRLWIAALHFQLCHGSCRPRPAHGCLAAAHCLLRTRCRVPLRKGFKVWLCLCLCAMQVSSVVSCVMNASLALSDTVLTAGNLSCAVVSLSTFALCMLMPKLLPRLPTAILCVAGFTALQMGGMLAPQLGALAGVLPVEQLPSWLLSSFATVPVLGSLPENFNLSLPSLPSWQAVCTWSTLSTWVSNSLLVFGLGSMQALMTSSAIDKFMLKRARAAMLPHAHALPTAHALSPGVATGHRGTAAPPMSQSPSSSVNVKAHLQDNKVPLHDANQVAHRALPQHCHTPPLPPALHSQLGCGLCGNTDGCACRN